MTGFAPPPAFAPAAPAAAPTGIVFSMPADPNWQPLDFADTLEMDGFYSGRITEEKVKDDKVIFRVEIIDEDAKGKKLDKFLGTKENHLWLWRRLILSLTSDLKTSQAAFQYQPGMFTGYTIYFKTEPYTNGDRSSTSIADLITQQEYEAQVKAGRHRWPSVPKASPMKPAGFGGIPQPGQGIAGMAFGVPAGIPQPQNASTTPNPQAAAALAAADRAPAPPPPAAPVPAPASTPFKFPGMK